jgi:multiple sugar transport system substrate-binding protein
MSALVLAAACGGGGGSPGGSASSGSSDEFSKHGPINYVQGKDTSVGGIVAKQLAEWNAAHPTETVTLIELPSDANAQRQQMIQNALIKSNKYSVLSMDVVWSSEFAANGYVQEMPAGFDTSTLLKPTVDAATYFNKLYGYPVSSDGGLLFYRKDLLDKAGITAAPTTWDEMKADCDKVQALPEGKGVDCYAGQFNKYEGLTVNFAEMVNGAGGNIVDESGKPVVNSPEATKGLGTFAGWFKDGTIPKGAITWTEEEGRTAFQTGKLVFLRNWAYVYAHATQDKNSVVKGKFAIAPLPGLTGPGVSSLGGHSMAISKFSDNKGTAVDFIKFMGSPEQQKKTLIETSSTPTIASLYKDPELVAKFAYLPTLQTSIETAKPRPKVVKYGDVTNAIQDAAYGALQGQTAPEAALSELQTKLETLTK